MGGTFDVMFEETDQRNDTLLFPCVVFLAAPGRNWALPAPLAKKYIPEFPQICAGIVGSFRASWLLVMVWEWRPAAELEPYEDLPKRVISLIRPEKSPSKPLGEWTTTLKNFQK